MKCFKVTEWIFLQQVFETKQSDYSYTFDKNICNFSWDEPKIVNNTFVVRLWILKDLPNVHLTIEIHELKNSSRSSQADDSNTLLLKHTMNLCYFDRQRRSNVFLRIWSDAAFPSSQYLNFKSGCPFKKGYYEIPEHKPMNPNEFTKYFPAYFKLVKKYQVKYTAQRKVFGRMEDFLRVSDSFDVTFKD